MSASDFTVLKKLGSGSFSDVYHVRRISDQTEYAMKKVKLQKLSKKEQENALNEIRILASVNHKNVIGYKEAFFDEGTNQLCIVMEIADGGDLDAKITQAKNLKSFVKEEKIWYIFKQMIAGLSALHEKKIVHRDIKCANVFLSNNGGVKLGDLNVSKVAKYGIMQTQTGTPYYCPPEVWQDKPYSSKCDIWSLGCVIYELTALKPPFLAKNMKELYSKVTRGHYPDIPRHFSRDLSKMIAHCLNTNPLLRPSAEELAAMPAFNEGAVTDAPGSNGGRPLHRRSNSQAEKQDDANKIELLKTIKLPRNLKQLNRGLLPEKNYDEDAIVAKETVNSHQIAKQKSSLADCQDQRLNYESDVGLRGREDIHARSPAVADSKRKALEARARKYRNGPNIQSKQQRLDDDESNDDVEPTRPDPGPARQEGRRQNHSIQSTRERPGNLLPQLNVNSEAKVKRALNRPPNIPPTPVKSSRPRPLKAVRLEESKENEEHRDPTLQGQNYQANQGADLNQGYSQRPAALGHQRFNYNQMKENALQENRASRQRHYRANSHHAHDSGAGGHQNAWHKPKDLNTIDQQAVNLRCRIAEHSPVQIRNAAERESGLYQHKKLHSNMNIDPSYPSLNQIMAEGAAAAGQQYSQRNLQNRQPHDFSRAGARYDSAGPMSHRIHSQGNLLSRNHNGVYNGRNQEQPSADKLPQFASEQSKPLMMKYDPMLNGVERANQIVGNAPPNNVQMKPPMSGRPARREKVNGASGLKSHRPPTGRQNALQPSGSQPAVADQVTTPGLQSRSPRYYGPVDSNGQQLNVGDGQSYLRTPQISASSGKKPLWWG